MYTATDFNCENAPKEMVQYVIDNVEDFDARYARALDIIGRYRCPLRMADDDCCEFDNPQAEAVMQWIIFGEEIYG